MNIFRRKTLESVRDNIKHDNLAKTLGSFDLLLLGIGAIIGTGIFVLTGKSAAVYAGPAVIFSFGLAAITCIFVALTYTEVASMIPTSGNVYSYAYIGMGEVIGWLVGWFLIWEYSVGASTVASGWSAYLVGILQQGGITLPEQLIKGPLEGGFLNLPAMFITLVMTSILIRGMKESATLNNFLVGVKLFAILLFIIIAAPKADLNNWSDFNPYGWGGVRFGASVVFFAFIGFDALASAAEECKDPKKDLTIGIIGSVIVCGMLYMLVAAFITLIIPYQELNNAEPLAYSLRYHGSVIGSGMIAVGGIAAMTSVLLVLMYGQSRILMVMSRDGLLPHIFARVHKKYQTPHYSTILIGIGVAIVSGIMPTEQVAQLTSIGTLIAFIAVGIVFMILRVKHPKIERTFRCPLYYIIGPIAILAPLYLLVPLLIENYIAVSVWIGLGLVVYFLYGYRNSNLVKYLHKAR